MRAWTGYPGSGSRRKLDSQTGPTACIFREVRVEEVVEQILFKNQKWKFLTGRSSGSFGMESFGVGPTECDESVLSRWSQVIETIRWNRESSDVPPPAQGTVGWVVCI